MSFESVISLNNLCMGSFASLLHSTSLFMLANFLSKFIVNCFRPPWLDIRIKHHVNLLQRPTCSFWVRKEDMESHRKAEDSKDNVRLPLDVMECRGDKVG